MSSPAQPAGSQPAKPLLIEYAERIGAVAACLAGKERCKVEHGTKELEALRAAVDEAVAQ